MDVALWVGWSYLGYSAALKCCPRRDRAPSELGISLHHLFHPGTSTGMAPTLVDWGSVGKRDGLD